METTQYVPQANVCLVNPSDKDKGDVSDIINMMKYGSVVSQEWHETREGKEFAGYLLRRNRRRMFGLLDSPNIPAHLRPDVVSYKIFLSGKTGVGKSSLVCKLQGTEIPKVHKETIGMQTSVVYWPAKLMSTQKVILFKFMFWDVGEHILKKFDHMLAACKERADAVFYVFSLTNRQSWDDLPALMSRTDVDDGMTKIAVGTKYDQSKSIQVTRKDIADFEKVWQIPVIKIGNVDGPRQADGKHLDGRAGIKDTAPFLNRLAELLWYRDQVMTGLVRPPKPSHIYDNTDGTRVFGKDDGEKDISNVSDPSSNISSTDDFDESSQFTKAMGDKLKVTFC